MDPFLALILQEKPRWRESKIDRKFYQVGFQYVTSWSALFAVSDEDKLFLSLKTAAMRRMIRTPNPKDKRLWNETRKETKR